MLGIAVVVGFLLHRSLFGFRLMAIGGNPEAGKLARLPVKPLQDPRLHPVLDPGGDRRHPRFLVHPDQPADIGLSQTFPVFAAVIIGGASLSGGKGTIIGTLGGALLLAELQIGLALLSPGPHVQQIFLGAVTIGAVALDLFLTKLRKSRAHDRGAGIGIRGVSKRYGTTIALNGIDLDILPGEVLGIAGPNGAGKSTLVRIIAGEERPMPAADLRRPAVVADRRLARGCGRPSGAAAVPQSDGGPERRRRARRHPACRPRLGDADAEVMEALGIGGLEDRALADCSLATQQRTEIARAVAREARVFLFDEPNSALTAEESDELFREMHKIAGGGPHRSAGHPPARATWSSTASAWRSCATAGSAPILSGEALTEDGIARQLVTESGAGAGRGRSARAAGRADRGAAVFGARLEPSRAPSAALRSTARPARSSR